MFTVVIWRLSRTCSCSHAQSSSLPFLRTMRAFQTTTTKFVACWLTNHCVPAAIHSWQEPTTFQCNVFIAEIEPQLILPVIRRYKSPTPIWSVTMVICVSATSSSIPQCLYRSWQHSWRWYVIISLNKCARLFSCTRHLQEDAEALREQLLRFKVPKIAKCLRTHLSSQSLFGCFSTRWGRSCLHPRVQTCSVGNCSHHQIWTSTLMV